MKYRSHALELIGDTPSLLFVGVDDHGEVRAAHFDPVLGLIPRRGWRDREQEQEETEAL